MSSKKSLVTTKDKIVKESNNDTRKKSNVVREAITLSMSKKKINTFNKTEKPHSSERKK